MNGAEFIYNNIIMKFYNSHRDEIKAGMSALNEKLKDAGIDTVTKTQK